MRTSYRDLVLLYEASQSALAAAQDRERELEDAIYDYGMAKLVSAISDYADTVSDHSIPNRAELIRAERAVAKVFREIHASRKPEVATAINEARENPNEN